MSSLFSCQIGLGQILSGWFRAVKAACTNDRGDFCDDQFQSLILFDIGEVIISCKQSSLHLGSWLLSASSRLTWNSFFAVDITYTGIININIIFTGTHNINITFFISNTHNIYISNTLKSTPRYEHYQLHRDIFFTCTSLKICSSVVVSRDNTWDLLQFWVQMINNEVAGKRNLMSPGLNSGRSAVLVRSGQPLGTWFWKCNACINSNY